MTRVSRYLQDVQRIGTDPLGRSCAVSVIVLCPANTRLEPLRTTLTSLLAQTFPDFDVMIVGEGLPEPVAACVREICASDPRFSACLHRTVCELPALRIGEGILSTAGTWIAYLEPGVEWAPKALERLTRATQNGSAHWVVAPLENLPGPAAATSRALPSHYSALVEANSIALAGVLHRRLCLEQTGLFDPHVYLARHWDWDMWLRFGSHWVWSPLSEPIGRLHWSAPGGEDATAPWREAAFRLAQGRDRRERLASSRWLEVEVDDPAPWGRMPEPIGERLRKFVLLPWRSRRGCPPADTLGGSEPPHLASVLMPVHNATVDVTIGAVQQALGKEADPAWQFAWYPLRTQVGSDTPPGDLLILHRTFDPQATAIQRAARRRDVPTLYLTDDDLLGLWEQFPEYTFLAPQAPLREELERQISAADLVMLYSHEAAEAYRTLNPRCVVRSVSIPEAWLEREFSEGETGAPLRIGFVGSAARSEELAFLQPALEAVSREWGNRVEFWFWGPELPEVRRLHSPYYHEPYSHSYEEYIRRLRRTHFDVLLAPLFDAPRARRAKTCIKYLEITAAGTVGIYSDVPPYAPVPSPECGLKVPNTVDGWRQAIDALLRMSLGQRRAMWMAAREDIRRRFTAEAHAPAFLAALEAAWLHKRTRLQRHADGRPRLAFLFHSLTAAGSELFHCRRAEIVREYGFEPVFAAPEAFAERSGGIREYALQHRVAVHFLPMTTHPHAEYPPAERLELERAVVRRWLQSERIALVHSTCFIPAAGLAAADLGVPHVAALYQPYREADVAFRPLAPHAALVDSDSFVYAAYWEQRLDVPAHVMRCPVPDSFFEVGNRRPRPSASAGERVRLAIMGALHERKGQRELLQALLELGEQARGVRLHVAGLSGYFPEYERECRELAQRLEAQGIAVEFLGFREDVGEILGATDALVLASRSESFPQVVLQAMAAGTLVVATPVGGVPELIQDGVTGILGEGFDAPALARALERYLQLTADERERIRARSRAVVRMAAGWSQSAHRLLRLYRKAFEVSGSPRRIEEAKPSFPMEVPLGEWESLPCPWGWREGISYPSRRPRQYRVTVPRDGLDGIQIRIGTHGRTLRADLRLTVQAADARGVAVRREAVFRPEGWLEDPAWITFRFPPIERSAGCEVVLQLRQEGAPATPLSVMQFEPAPTHLGRKVQKRLTGGPAVPQLRFSFRGE